MLEIQWNRSRALRSLASVGLLAIAYVAGNHTPSIRVVKAQSPLVPLTAVVHEYSTKEGARRLRSEYTHAIRSDGSRVLTKHAYTGTKQDQLSVASITLSDGRTAQIIPELKLKSTIFRDEKMRASERAGELDPASGCLEPFAAWARSSTPVTLLRNDQFLGYQTKVVARGVPGRLLKDYHYAVDLGCYPLLERHEFFGASGNLEELVEKEVVRLTPGEPSGSFMIPQDYEEVSPSQLRARIASFVGLPAVPSCMRESLTRMDDGYQRLRPPQSR